MFVGGRWTEAQGGGRWTLTDPATEAPIEEVAFGGAEDARRALDAAAEAFPAWSKKTAYQRAAVLEAAAARIAERVEDYARRTSEEQMETEANRAGQASVTLRGVTKRFGDFTAVDAIDLEIGQGEFFTLLGPSGCGKTTTLRMIAGFEDLDGGQILIEDSDVAGLPAHRRPTARSTPHRSSVWPSRTPASSRRQRSATRSARSPSRAAKWCTPARKGLRARCSSSRTRSRCAMSA